jgi:hypothetical protein
MWVVQGIVVLVLSRIDGSSRSRIADLAQGHCFSRVGQVHIAWADDVGFTRDTLTDEPRIRRDELD